MRVPELRGFDLALNEVWLQAGRGVARQRAGLPDADLRQTGVRASIAIIAVDATVTPTSLRTKLQALEMANPGSEGYLVLYDRGATHDDAHRALLTREVALTMVPGASLPVDWPPRTGSVRRVAGVADAYVVRAEDPLASLTLVEWLRSQAGVRSAYSLLKRHEFAR